MNEAKKKLNTYLAVKSQEIKKEKGLIVNWVQNTKDLTQAGKEGLFSMYCNIFAEAPYNEKFTESEVNEYFEGIIKADGFVFTAKKEQSKLLTAFVASTPLNKKEAVIELVKPYIDIETSAYFAEDAVLPEYRRQGISRTMKKLLIGANVEAGYKNMLLRTSVNSFNQAAAIKQLGGVKIKGLYQDVDSLRLNGKTTSDKRQFFTLKLKKE